MVGSTTNSPEILNNLAICLRSERAPDWTYDELRYPDANKREMERSPSVGCDLSSSSSSTFEASKPLGIPVGHNSRTTPQVHARSLHGYLAKYQSLCYLALIIYPCTLGRVGSQILMTQSFTFCATTLDSLTRIITLTPTGRYLGDDLC